MATARRVSLRLKAMAGLSLVLLPLLGLLLFGLSEHYEMRRAALLDGLHQTADASSLLVDGTLASALELAQTLAAEAALRRLDSRELRPFLERVAQGRKDLVNLVVLDTEGQPLVTLAPFGEARTYADRTYFQRTLSTGHPTLSEVLMGRATDRPVAVAAAPILEGAGAVKGVVAVGLQLERLAERMKNIGLRPGQALFVADPSGRLAFHSRRQSMRWDERDISGRPEVRAARGGQPVLSTSFLGVVGDDQRIAALVASAEHGWIVGVTWGQEDAFREMDAVRRQQMAAFVAIALLALAGTWLLASYLGGRVERLVRRARALERGEFDAAHPPVRPRRGPGDELDELSEAFTRMAAELQREREQRETFVSSVAHDLRNLLSPLTLTAQALREPERLAPAARVRSVGRLGEQVARVQRLVLDLLDVSRISSGQFSLEPHPHELMASVRSVVEEQQAAAPGHRLVLRGPERLEVQVDPDRIAQVLTNLVGNAVKYSPAGSEVRVEVEVEPAQLRIAVADSGIGLLPQELAELFRPYGRAEGARSFQGLGLGLSICRAIIEAHGGTIRAASAGRGCGSVFTVTLPRGTRPEGGAGLA